MIAVVSITLPIFLSILAGYAAARFGAFEKPEMRVFGRFVIGFAMPALLFRALATRSLAEVFNPTYMLAYLAGTLALLASGYLACRRRGLSGTASTVYAMGMTCPNSGFVGYPILLLFLAPVAGVALALNMMVENLVVIPLLLALADLGSGGGSWSSTLARSLGALARNPLVLAILAGFSVSALRLPIPEPLMRTVDLFAAASGALSLFVIGGSLIGLPLGQLWRQAVPIALGKLVIHPLCVALALLGLHALGMPRLDGALASAAVLLAAMPMMSIYPTLAQAYGQEDIAAPALLITTLASFFTLSLALWLVERFPVVA